MPRGHHSHRSPRRSRRSALLIAPLATVAVVGAGVALSGGAQPDRPATPAAVHLAPQASFSVSTRTQAITRSFDRMDSPALMNAPGLAKVTGHEWTTAALDLRSAPAEKAAVVGEVKSAKKVGTTGRRYHGFAQVVVDGKARWVHADYLSADKPAANPAQMGLVFTPCANTASVENGLVPDMIRAWEAVCNQFPQITTYGGLGNRPEHDTGHAVDAMTNDPTVGYAIAAFLQAHASELNIYDIIYRQHIWTPVRASEGWRLMPDRGSPTANHYDHVHFGVN